MPAWARSIFGGVVLLLLAYLAIAWAIEVKAGVWGWGAILVVLAGWMFFRVRRLVRARRARRESHWERAIYDDSLRPRAIREVRSALERAGPPARDNLEEVTRLSLTLAELLDANDDYEEAMALVDSIPVEQLRRLDAGLVRHTRAVTRLRAGDHQGALEALRGRQSTGDRELDQRLVLLEAYARVEAGEAGPAMEQVERIEGDEAADPSVATEARVVMAAALDVLGDREQAMVVLASVGRSSLEPLSLLGMPRVRSMAREILRGTSSRPPPRL